MTIRTLELHLELELPPAIVWDALVDPLLVGGWLGDARIDPVVGGRYDLDWVGSTEFPATDGRITELVEPELLVVATSVHGVIGFELERCFGGARGTWTRLHLRVEVDVDDVFAQRISSNWAVALDQLEELLRGHPVDWSPTTPQESRPSANRDIGRR